MGEGGAWLQNGPNDETMTDSVSNPDELEPTGGPSEAAEGTEDDLESSTEPTSEDLDLDDVLEEVEALLSDENAAQDDELVALREDFEGLNDRHLRLAAEFNNYRRRVEAERLDLWARAQADLVGRFLDVLDDLQRVAGLDLENATVEAIMEGIDLVDRKFVRVLGDAGAEVIDPTGEAFDPERMEAMMRVPTEDEDQDDVVDQVFLKGYSLKGHLVRPARVSVRKHG